MSVNLAAPASHTRFAMYKDLLTCMHYLIIGHAPASESVMCALECLDNDTTQQTRLFIQMVDKFSDCLNAKGPSSDAQTEEKG